MLNHDLTVKINVRDNIPLAQSDKPLSKNSFLFLLFFGRKMLPEILLAKFEFLRQKLHFYLSFILIFGQFFKLLLLKYLNFCAKIEYEEFILLDKNAF